MDSRVLWLFVFVWHAMMILVCARNMHIATSHGLLHQGLQIMQSPGTPFTIKEVFEMKMGFAIQKGWLCCPTTCYCIGIGSKAKEEEVLSRLGSRPPRCEHKCKGCTPCSPIQVPTVHLGPLYANYEPEGWKCKCGLFFYDP